MKILVLVLFISSCLSLKDDPPDLGVDTNGKLKPCPDKPNCVNSQSNNPEKKIASLPSQRSPSAVFAQIKKFSDTNYNVIWKKQTEDYISGRFG